MIRSMTGYGRAESCAGDAKIIIEIRSVNGKFADINLKSSLILRHKEAEVRLMLATALQRGSIDLYVTSEQNGQAERPVNRELFLSYYQAISSIQKELSTEADPSGIIAAILRIPEVMERKNSDPDEERWVQITAGIQSALTDIDRFRLAEGERLAQEVLERVALIESYIYKVEELETARLEVVRERLSAKLNELAPALQPDTNRFEQELIYYLEKLDITEEKVRLRQHCAFFRQTAKNEPCPGRKLGFIAQEMGREINTMGSKANHASMQQWVVMMKDELEKIKEQALNIL